MQSDLQPLTLCAVLRRDDAPRAEPPIDELERATRPASTSSTQQHEPRIVETRSDSLQNGRPTKFTAQEYGSQYQTVENIDIDPNLERRKRRKTTPFEDTGTVDGLEDGQTEMEEEANGDRPWFEQLREAANADSPDKTRLADTDMVLVEPPQTPSGGSPVKLAIRKSPRKMPRNQPLAADTPVPTPPDLSRPKTRTTRSGSKPISSPKISETPKKKVLKLTSKGKLLSSPPSVSPASKRKGRSKTAKPPTKAASKPRKATRISYGSDKDSKKRIGGRIDSILSQKVTPTKPTQPKVPEPPKVTHPFFLGKAARSERTDVIVIEDGSMTGQDSDAEGKQRNEVKKPVAWKDLTFKSNKASTQRTVVNTVHPLWPPKDMQHLGVTNILPTLQHKSQSAMIRRGASKAKAELCTVPDTENILRRYAATLQYHRGRVHDAFPLPEKLVVNGRDMLSVIESVLLSSVDSSSPRSNALKDAYPTAFEHMRHRLLLDFASSRNDVTGVAQSWLSNSAPVQAGQVLQAQSSSLCEWLLKHKVSHAATKLTTVQKPKPVRKRGRKKKADDLDDFIASDEEEEQSGTTKNAIIISGPHGCGKTASVYAAAKELDFEVFEIHPGMRRTAKDIFDKVGDMTQNHLVHKAPRNNNECISPARMTALSSSSDESVQDSQNAMQSFLKGKKQTTTKGTGVQARPGTPLSEVSQKSEKQKQSLILFEEVDILFEEDKGFWTGVVQLLEQSKRPVILTCNDPTTIPIQNLPIYASLEYKEVPTEVAVDYILMLAAAEGHQIERGAIQSLYLSKDMDLRATISELDFWCQMAVGSEKGGLDWIVDRRTSDGALACRDEKLRLFSKDTFTNGMGLVPQTLLIPDASNRGALLQHAQEELGIPMQYWHNRDDHRHEDPTTEPDQRLQSLQQYQMFAEARSSSDLFNNAADNDADTLKQQCDILSAELEGRILAALRPRAPALGITDIVSAHIRRKTPTFQLTSNDVSAAFEPLMTEKPRFPPSTGRLAPSLDTSSVTVITDIAPYVRSIVRYDRLLQEQRYAMAGGPHKTKMRGTRAARAAIEGGSKASTRDEKWFPKATDYDSLLQTGGAWPQWGNELSRTGFDESTEGSESRTESEATSPAAVIEMTDGA
jgi:DNA polymerase III delta prime subunit